MACGTSLAPATGGAPCQTICRPGRPRAGGRLAANVQQVTGSTVELAYVDQGYTGPNASEAASQHGIRLEVVKHPLAKRGFVLLPRRLGRRTKLRLGRMLPETRQRLRTAQHQPQRPPLHRLRPHHDHPYVQSSRLKDITAFKSTIAHFEGFSTCSLMRVSPHSNMTKLLR